MSGATSGTTPSRCETLHAYVDGELDADDHAEFEAHLVTCEACNAELPRLLALSAALDGAAGAAPSAPSKPPHLTLVTGSDGDGPHREPASHAQANSVVPGGSPRG